MSANGASNFQNQSGARLLIHWVIVLVCSLMLPCGIIVFVIAALSNSTFGGRQFHLDQYILGVLLIFGAPLLLGLYFKANWRGLLSGFLAIVWVFAVIGSSAVRLIHVPDSIFAPFLILVVAGAAAILLIVSERVKTKTDFAGLGLGLAIGCLLAFLALYILPNRWWGWGPISALPAIILNAVLFPDLLSRRAGWSSILIVGVMLVITVFIDILGP